MATSGTLTRVGTKIARINLDISRKLNWGRGLVLEFVIVDRSETDGWAIVDSYTRGFDRRTDLERTQGDGADVIFEVVDENGDLPDTLETKGLHIRVDGEIYPVAKTPPVASSEVQTYIISCKTRTRRTVFDTTK